MVSEASGVMGLCQRSNVRSRRQLGSRICSLPGDPKTIRGFSAPALILEDEAAFVDDELFAAIKPMLAVSRGQLILMSTPFGRRGHFFDTRSEEHTSELQSRQYLVCR